jgi:homoserine kinase type II
VDETVPRVLPPPRPRQRELIDSELAFQHSLPPRASYAALPRGPIHADLFRDNVMFEDAPTAAAPHRLLRLLLRRRRPSLLRHRGVPERLVHRPRVRPPGRGACRGLRRRLRTRCARSPAASCGCCRRCCAPAALRFWISRLWDFHLPRAASMLTPHDPGHFERVLRERVATPWHPVAPA